MSLRCGLKTEPPVVSISLLQVTRRGEGLRERGGAGVLEVVRQ